MRRVHKMYYYCNTIAIQFKHNMYKKQFLNNMIEKLLNKIEELIKDCPSDWAKKAAEKMDPPVKPSTVGRIRRGELGKRDCTQQISLIKALKVIKEEYQNEFNQAIL